MSKIESRNEILLVKLEDYYKDSDKKEEMFRYITNHYGISLRLIDWCVTNFSKNNKISYNINTINGTKRVVIYDEYKNKLKSYSKQLFDPFCRHVRIKFHYKDNIYFETTLGQLNFFKWILEDEIDKYLRENYKEIEKDMNSKNLLSKKRIESDPDNKNKTRKKKDENIKK
uniref:Uncharacterized protein n=1 Tax=viral metagenome TaxID=1070528 RepID=A0A6C0H627_9ZZZZ